MARSEETAPIDRVALRVAQPKNPNTGVDYWLSNDGGARWYLVRPKTIFSFPTTGADLRWRAELRSLSPALTPKVNTLLLVLGQGSIDGFSPSESAASIR